MGKVLKRDPTSKLASVNSANTVENTSKQPLITPGIMFGTITRRIVATITTDATGNVGGGMTGAGFPLFDIPTGMSAKLHRTTLTAGQYTPLAPLTTGQLAWYWNQPGAGSLVMFLPAGGAVAPIVITEGFDASWGSDGDQLVVVGAGLPVNLTLTFTFQVEQLEASQPGRGIN